MQKNHIMDTNEYSLWEKWLWRVLLFGIPRDFFACKLIWHLFGIYYWFEIDDFSVIGLSIATLLAGFALSNDIQNKSVYRMTARSMVFSGLLFLIISIFLITNFAFRDLNFFISPFIMPVFDSLYDLLGYWVIPLLFLLVLYDMIREFSCHAAMMEEYDDIISYLWQKQYRICRIVFKVEMVLVFSDNLLNKSNIWALNYMREKALRIPIILCILFIGINRLRLLFLTIRHFRFYRS